MSDTFITVIAIMATVVLMFTIPFIATANQNDRITQSNVQAIVDNFTNTVAREGKISESTYADLIQQLGATGNTYAIEIEVQHIDQNPQALKGANIIGENNYYSEFTSEIVKKIGEGNYNLKQGDYIIVTVENTNVTTATKLKNAIYSLTGKDPIAIEVSSAVLNTKNGY